MRYTDAEWERICEVAAAEGLKPGAWVQQKAYDDAVALKLGETVSSSDIQQALHELAQHRHVLMSIGRNLNQFLKVAHARGDRASWIGADRLLHVLRNVVRGSDDVVSKIRDRLT